MRFFFNLFYFSTYKVFALQMTKIAGTFHSAISIAFIWGAYQDMYVISGPGLPIPGNYFSKVVWLTIINLYIQIFYHLYSVYLSTRSRALQQSAKYYHFLSNALVFPAALTVGIMFWGLYLAHRDLIIPEGFSDPLEVHPYFNHVLHTLPAIAMAVDRILWNHGRTTKRNAMTLMTIFIILYIIDIHVIHAISGFWPYGILTMLPSILRMVFLFCGGMVLFASYFVGDLITAWVHPLKVKSKN